MKKKSYFRLVPVLFCMNFLAVTAYCTSEIAVKSKKTSQIKILNPPMQNFFAKELLCHSIPILGSKNVSDKAFKIACYRISRMLRHIPVVRDNLISAGAKVEIIATNEQVSDLPAWRHFKGKPFRAHPNEKVYASVDQRVRGFGGIPMSCGEENLLKLPSDRYKYHRDICTHEFAHTILSYGLSKNIQALVKKQYQASMARGLWKTAYASTNVDEFFAELSMWYFGSRGDYGHIKPSPRPGKKWFKQYDPDAYKLLDNIYSGREDIKPINYVILPLIPGSQAQNLHSGNGSQDTEVIIVNKTSHSYKLYWIDFNGKRKLYGDIYPGGVTAENTFASHLWLITDKNGQSVALFRAQSQPGKVILH